LAKGIPTKKKVLIVEDDRELADALKDRLKKEGYESQVTPNGETLPEKSSKYRPQLIVLDLNLPKRSGFLALGDLKADVETEGIPVLVLTVRRTTTRSSASARRRRRPRSGMPSRSSPSSTTPTRSAARAKRCRRRPIGGCRSSTRRTAP
jgi:CheY-like chemotaxis protein